MTSTPGVDVAEQEAIFVHGVANLVVVLQQPLELESAGNKLPFNSYPGTRNKLGTRHLILPALTAKMRCDSATAK
jgi:DNA integrity scanning protein DisA with diadenylate cyclase activity